KEEGIERDVRIFMNNTLLHKGYKFFQSSYDQDEKGTVLSVNYDLWGTWISYLSYVLLIAGFILSLINKNSYFRILINRLKKNSMKVTTLLIIMMGLAFNTHAQEDNGTGIPGLD